MKIGIIRETKTPEDNRVALTPDQIKDLQERYKSTEFIVQSSPIRAYSDDEYQQKGITVRDDISDCDILLGIKEAKIDSLIPDKHYFFFGHIAKLQAYNKPLLKAMIRNNLTFSDWEYIVDDEGKRLVAFGWYAGVVGVYYTLMGWGRRYNTAELPHPDMHFSKEKIINILKSSDFKPAKILLTGTGRVSHGAKFILDAIGAKEIGIDEYLSLKDPESLVYTIASAKDLVKHKTSASTFDMNHFCHNPEEYVATMDKFAMTTDILISCHFWEHDQPVYITEELMKSPDFRIKMIGDITCDIKGSIKSTIRSSTHAKPFYDYNPITGEEELPFSSDNNITVMAVDTCPNALPRETSEFFGSMFIEHIIPSLIKDGIASPVVNRACLLINGKVNAPFDYLNEYLSHE